MKLNGNAFSNWNDLCDNGNAMGKGEWGIGMEFCSAIEWNFCGFSIFFLIYLWSVNAGGIARQGPARLGPARPYENS